METAMEVAWFPEVSTATAVRLWAPFDSVVVSKEKL
jgi:hypothetical protein